MVNIIILRGHAAARIVERRLVAVRPSHDIEPWRDRLLIERSYPPLIEILDAAWSG